MELIYLVSGGDLTKMNELFSMSAHQFIFIAEYLSRKNKIEIQEARQRLKKI